MQYTQVNCGPAFFGATRPVTVVSCSGLPDTSTVLFFSFFFPLAYPVLSSGPMRGGERRVCNPALRGEAAGGLAGPRRPHLGLGSRPGTFGRRSPRVSRLPNGRSPPGGDPLLSSGLPGRTAVALTSRPPLSGGCPVDFAPPQLRSRSYPVPGVARTFRAVPEATLCERQLF